MILYEKLANCNRIVSFGCSMIYGDEFPDCNEKTFSKFVYPALFAKELDKEYITYSRNGLGNEAIQKTINNYLMTDTRPGDFVFIGWSGLFRKRLYCPEQLNYLNCVPNYDWESSTKTHSEKKKKGLQRVFSYYQDIIEVIPISEILIEFAADVNITYKALEYYNLPFLMTRVISDSEPIIHNLRNLLSNHVNFYMGHESIMDYLYSLPENSKYRFPRNHPNEYGHIKIKNLLESFMKTI